jgi:two-component system, NarL family, sensor histidine kinase LiaS
VSQERSFGLQWRLAVFFLTVGSGSSLVALVVYITGKNLALSEPVSVVLGFGAGVLVGLAGAVVGSIITRSFKLRLWEAGRMANRIARGDYRARLEIGTDDEVGWLEEQLNGMGSQLESAVNALKELAEQNRRLGEEAGRGAALEERMRLARDLHDTVNQQLFVLAMRTAAVRRRLEQAEGEVSLLGPEIAGLENLARQAHSQIRELILQIRPVKLEKEGLAAALQEYVISTAEREGWEATSDIDPSIRSVGPAAESLFRIAQEALNNISKHAAASAVAIKLVREGSGIKLSISDNGVGFEPASIISPTALGLSGIRERISALGGRVNISSAPGQGTEITVLAEISGEGGEDE